MSLATAPAPTNVTTSKPAPGRRVRTRQRLALVHEWLPLRAGSESTFRQMAEALPEASLYALSHNTSSGPDFAGRDVSTTFLNNPFQKGGNGLLLPLTPLAWASQRPNPFDYVLTSSHALSRSFPPARFAVHLSYTYAPMRYVWNPEIDHGRSRWQETIARTGARPLKALDLHYVKTVNSFAGISRAIVERIQDHYDRDARLIFPPVDVGFFCPDPSGTAREDFLLSCSRLVPYKMHDLAIEAAALADAPIVIVGNGPDEHRLRALAERVHPHGVTFITDASRSKLRELMRRTRALLFPALEDFGIVPVEAQACGTPAIGFRAGGSRDTIVDGVTGLLVGEQTPTAFAAAISQLDQMVIDPNDCTAHAASFSPERFTAEIRGWLSDFGYRPDAQ